MRLRQSSVCRMPFRDASRSRRARHVGLLAAAVMAAGCSFTTSSASFQGDDRLSFATPAAHSVVRIPVALSWQIDDFRLAAPGSEPPTTHAGYFALFVDGPPVAPRDTLQAVARGDRLCNPRVGCPDKAYLEQRQVFTSNEPSYTLESLHIASGESEDLQLHHVTVVLMDTAGHRIGESAWTLPFKMRSKVV